MPIYTDTELIIERRYDPWRARLTVNGATHVLHCHHYLSLYTQLAEDCGMLDGAKLLAEVAEDAFYSMLAGYFQDHRITILGDRIALAEQYYAFSGLGRMKITAAGPDSGVVELESSHVDAGWLKKWGARAKPVNHVTRGYVAATFAAVFELPSRTWRVGERESIVSGAERSIFIAIRN